MPRFESRRLLPLPHAPSRYAVNRVASSGGSRQCGAARTAKAGSSVAGLSASAAEKGCSGSGLGRGSGWLRGRDLPSLPRRERPDQGDNPPDKGPTGEQIQEQDSREVGPIARQIGGQKIEKQGNKHENRMEVKEGDEKQGRDQHGTRSAKTHGVFYHGLTGVCEYRSQCEPKARSSRPKPGLTALAFTPRFKNSVPVETQDRHRARHMTAIPASPRVLTGGLVSTPLVFFRPMYSIVCPTGTEVSFSRQAW